MSAWTNFRNRVLNRTKEEATNGLIELVTIKLFGKKIDVDRDVRDKLRSQKAEIVGLKKQLKDSGNIIEGLQKELFLIRNDHSLPNDFEESFDFEEF